MKKIVITLTFLIPFGVLAQAISDDFDTRYREDQFYFGFTYNTLTNTPEEFSQTGFSLGFKLGFIRDFPINTKRTLALGLGLGYAFNAYFENIKTTESTTLNYVDYKVVDTNGRLIGSVQPHTIPNVQPLIQVATTQGSLLIPMVEPYLTSIDSISRKIVVSNLENLIEA